MTGGKPKAASFNLLRATLPPRAEFPLAAVARCRPTPYYRFVDSGSALE
jgi:hypothetical protein